MRFPIFPRSVVFFILLASIVFDQQGRARGASPPASRGPVKSTIHVLKVWKEETSGGVRLFVRLRRIPSPAPGESVLLGVLVNGQERGTVRIAHSVQTVVLPFLPGKKDRITFAAISGVHPVTGSGEDASGLCDDAGSPVRIAPGSPPLPVVSP